MATQMTELVKTEFDKLDVYKRREPISKDDAQGLFGEDVVLKKMNDQTSQNTKGVFAERFEEAEIPKETVETKIRTGFKSTFHNKTVSFLTVGKRADEAKKKHIWEMIGRKSLSVR